MAEPEDNQPNAGAPIPDDEDQLAGAGDASEPDSDITGADDTASDRNGGADAASSEVEEAPVEFRNPGESNIEALIRLTNEHARAAETGSPDQPYILTARRAASLAVQASVTDMAALAMRNPAYIDVLTADISQPDPAKITMKSVAAALGITQSWNDLDDATRQIFTNPAVFYRHAKSVHAAHSGTTRARYMDAALLDSMVKTYAGQLVREGRIIDLAMENPTLARTCLADAGLPPAATSAETVQTKTALAKAYLAANRDAVTALGARDWVAYGVAARTRLHVMASIYRDPAALVALGTLAGEQGIDLRGKAAADHALVRAQLDRGEDKVFDNRLKEFEASFLKDLTVQGSDPVKRWIKIQNEIEAQEMSGVRSGPDLAYLRKISEKTALEVAAVPANFKRIAQDRPDLMQKLAIEADKGKESTLTVGKETAIGRRNDGALVENRAAAERNAGATAPEAAAAAPESTNVDRQTSDLAARTEAEAPKPANGLSANPADRILPSGAIPPSQAQSGARQPGGSSQGTAGQAPSAGTQAGQAQAGQAQAGRAQGPQAGSGQANQGAARQAGPAGQGNAGPTTGAAAINHATKPLTEAQVKARSYTSSKHPEFDQDLDDHFKFDARKELGLYVNSRTPYTKQSLDGQLNDTRKLVFAAPLNTFMSAHHQRVKKDLKAIAKSDPERFKKMYQATKNTWNAWQDAPGERNKTALDQLEMGRRILAEVGVITGVLEAEKAAHHAKPLFTRVARELSPAARWDPGDFMQKRDVKKYAAYLGRISLGKIVDKSYTASSMGWKKALERVKKHLTKDPVDKVKEASNALADFVT